MQTIGTARKSELLSAAVAASPTAMLLTDPNRPGSPIVRANAAFSELTGYSEAELLGCAPPPLAGLDGPASERVRQALGGREPASLEFEGWRKDGSRFPAALSVGPVRDGEAGVRYLFCTLFHLGGRGELVRGFGHDMNNLLTVMRSSLEPLLRAPADVRAPQRLERIGWAVDRAAQAVREFTARFRPEPPPAPVSGRLPAAREGEFILLVEADEVLGLQAGSMLRGLGYRIACVSETEAALAMLSGQERVDLLIADARARCDGGALLAERARAARKELKILHSSKSAPRGPGEIGKPFQLIELARAVREAIDVDRPA